jgi:hypothetical protein
MKRCFRRITYQTSWSFVSKWEACPIQKKGTGKNRKKTQTQNQTTLSREKNKVWKWNPVDVLTPPSIRTASSIDSRKSSSSAQGFFAAPLRPTPSARHRRPIASNRLDRPNRNAGTQLRFLHQCSWPPPVEEHTVPAAAGGEF